VCDLETSRMGAPYIYIYIYDISRLRVKVREELIKLGTVVFCAVRLKDNRQLLRMPILKFFSLTTNAHPSVNI